MHKSQLASVPTAKDLILLHHEISPVHSIASWDPTLYWPLELSLHLLNVSSKKNERKNCQVCSFPCMITFRIHDTNLIHVSIDFTVLECQTLLPNYWLFLWESLGFLCSHMIGNFLDGEWWDVFSLIYL